MKKIRFSYILIFLLSINGVLSAQNQWDARLVLNRLDCQNRQAWYTLELKSSSEEEWALADQNYRLFYDGDLMTVKSVNSLLPATTYSAAAIDQNLKMYGRDQEKYSPLDQIDDHLGFLDFSIVLKNKANPNGSVMMRQNRFTAVAEIFMNIDAASLNDLDPANALKMYFSRQETAGNVTRQFSTLTEHHGVNQTQATSPGKFFDLTYETGKHARLGFVCDRASTKGIPFSRVLDRKIIDNIEQGTLGVFPNPARGQISYHTQDISLDVHEVMIYDQFNRLLQRWEKPGSSTPQSISISKLPQGVYTLVLKNADTRLEKRFVKISN